MLFQGEAYAEFKELWDDAFNRAPPMSEAIRLINTQSSIIEESLNQQMMTISQRKQVMVYMLEQCIMLCSVLPVDRAHERRRFRVIRRFAERMRRVTRGDGL